MINKKKCWLPFLSVHKETYYPSVTKTVFKTEGIYIFACEQVLFTPSQIIHIYERFTCNHMFGFYML